MKAIRELVIARNHQQSRDFASAEARLARSQYRAKYPTEIAAFKCMDGRLNLSVITETPLGIIQPFRNIGAKFDLGWTALGEIVREWIEKTAAKGKNCLVLATYHFSKGDPNRGCAGFNYDTSAARASAERLRSQFDIVLNSRQHSVVYPVLVGIETDEDALVFHGSQGVLDMGAVSDMSEEEVRQALASLYPDMTEEMRKDLLPLVLGNQRHVRGVRRANRPPMELDHREQVIAVGRGFDWLHWPNKALIIGPYSHDWPSAVETAGNIVLKNIQKGQISADAEVLLLICSLPRAEEGQGSLSWNLAIEKAKYLTRHAHEVLQEKVPQLASRLTVLSGVVDPSTRLLHELENLPAHEVIQFRGSNPIVLNESVKGHEKLYG